MFGRRNIATYVAEFLGTGVITLLILSVQRSTIGVPFFVALAAGVTLALMTFAVGAYATGFFNPAITLGLWTARRIATVQAILMILLQLLGAGAAYWLYTYFVKSSLQNVGGHYSTRILVAETVGTGILAFGIAAALYQRLTAAVTASMAGLAYMVGIIAASSASIGLLNPAAALGVRAWVWGTYVLGPVLGAVIGINLYNLVFAETAVATAAADAAVASGTSATTSSRVARGNKKTTSRRTTAKPAAKRRSTRR
jgi:aquaporin Z